MTKTIKITSNNLVFRGATLVGRVTGTIMHSKRTRVFTNDSVEHIFRGPVFISSGGTGIINPDFARFVNETCGEYLNDQNN